MQVAILIDGGFFLKRARHVYPGLNTNDPEAVAGTIYRMATRHLYRRAETARLGKTNAKETFSGSSSTTVRPWRNGFRRLYRKEH